MTPVLWVLSAISAAAICGGTALVLIDQMAAKAVAKVKGDAHNDDDGDDDGHAAA